MKAVNEEVYNELKQSNHILNALIIWMKRPPKVVAERVPKNPVLNIRPEGSNYNHLVWKCCGTIWCTTMSTNIFTLSTSYTIYTVSITFLSFTMCHCRFTTLFRIIPITTFTTITVISITCTLLSPPRILVLGSSMALVSYGQTPAFLNHYVLRSDSFEPH